MLIRNGTIVLEDGTHKSDIRIEGEIINEIAPSLAPRGNEPIIDAAGKFIMPGGIDVHTHMDLDLGDIKASDDFYTGTIAAACGGTTTIVDHMAFGPAGCSISHQLDTYHGLAQGKAVIDYSFHGVFSRVDDGILKEITALANEGITSHKFYLTYSGKISDTEIMRLMDHTASLGVMLTAHAENDGAITYLREKYLLSGKKETISHARSRPSECEAEAIFRMLMFARMMDDAPIYIVHLSSGLGLECIRLARAGGQKNIFVETCPQYLLLDESLYLKDDGSKYVMSPPLRKKSDQEALLSGIRSGDIDVIGTDHCPFFYEQKKRGFNDFTKIPSGIPGVETRMPLLLTEVCKGNLTPQLLVSLCSANPARLFGLYPKKGVIAAGSDADLIIIDQPDNLNSNKNILTKNMLHENTDYTPYEGLPFHGFPLMTISRGEIIVQDGIFQGQKGRGRFIKRKLPELKRNLIH